MPIVFSPSNLLNFPQLLALLGAPGSVWPAVCGWLLSWPNSAKHSHGLLLRSPEFSLCGIFFARTPTCSFLTLWPPLYSALSLQPSKTNLGLGNPTVQQSENHFQALGWGNCKAHLLYLLSLKVHRPVLAASCARSENNYFIYFMQSSLCLWREGSSVAVDPSR